MILLKIKYAISILGFKYSTSSLSGLLNMDEYAIKRIIREKEDLEDRKASIQAWKGKSVEFTSYLAD